MLANLHPQVDHPVLQVLELPEERLVDARVGVPALVLAAGEGVHVDDGVEALGGAGAHDAVEQSEAVGLDDGGAERVDEVAVVDGDADAV